MKIRIYNPICNVKIMVNLPICDRRDIFPVLFVFSSESASFAKEGLSFPSGAFNCCS